LTRREQLAELLGSLSLATEAAVGVPPETSIRAAVVSVALARALGLSDGECAGAYLVSLLRYIGCSGFAWETSWYGGGDDISLLGDLTPLDAATPLASLSTIVRKVGHRQGLASRARSVVRVLSDPTLPQRVAATHCAQAVALTESLGLGEPIPQALGDIYERFDGRGGPARKRGHQMSLLARIVRTALLAVIHGALDGPAGAVAAVRTRLGGELDPDVGQAFLEKAQEILKDVMRPSAWDAFMASNPPGWADDHTGLDVPAIALAFARCVDLKSPWTLAHSTGVATLCRAALARAGASADEAEAGYVSGLLHDLGRLSVPNGIWDKKGPLTPMELTRMRSHVSVSEAVVARSLLLAAHAGAVGAHHERLDGSGYPRQTSGKSTSRVALTLAAADVFHALIEDRPHRPQRSPEDAASVVREEVRAGRLDGRAADTVCAAAGARPAGLKGEAPLGLSDREVEVLTLLARGLSNKEIGTALFISARTAGNHVAHIYDKTGINTRAGAALFAVTRGLV
jgi:HD-GYP domain-containing protein (c-di-GMP phosphodiesterase class II)